MSEEEHNDFAEGGGRPSTYVPTSYRHYQRSTLGECFRKAIASLETEELISAVQSDKCMLQFDRAINEALGRQPERKMQFSGKLHTYRNCDSVWEFVLERATVNVTDKDKIEVDGLQITACEMAS